MMAGTALAAGVTMSTRTELRRAREVERAWRLHDPWRQGRIPPAAKEALAVFKRGLAAPATAIETHLFAANGIPDAVITDCIMRRGVARQRALARARAALPGAQLGGSRDVFEARWIVGRDHLIADAREPSELQDCVVVHVAMCWREPNGATSFFANWLLEVPDHAGGRFCSMSALPRSAMRSSKPPPDSLPPMPTRSLRSINLCTCVPARAFSPASWCAAKSETADRPSMRAFALG